MTTKQKDTVGNPDPPFDDQWMDDFNRSPAAENRRLALKKAATNEWNRQLAIKRAAYAASRARMNEEFARSSQRRGASLAGRKAG